MAAQFKQGRKDYYVGGHPLWETLRSLQMMRRRPWVTGGVWLLAGYVWSAVTRVESPVSEELRAFHQGEQKERLWRMVRFRFRSPAATAGSSKGH